MQPKFTVYNKLNRFDDEGLANFGQGSNLATTTNTHLFLSNADK